LSFGGVEHVLEQKFSYETFNTFLQHIYGNKVINISKKEKFSYETFNTFLQHIYGNKVINISKICFAWFKKDIRSIEFPPNKKIKKILRPFKPLSMLPNISKY